MSTISEQLQQLNNIKNSFKETINAKGGSITDTTPFSEYPSQVENLSGGGKAIIDVEELPKEGWKGTVVPNSGYVEKVYFNTNLTNDEVVNIINSIPNESFINFFGSIAYLIICDENEKGIMFVKGTESIDIVDMSNNNIIFSSNSGWSIQQNIYEINANVINQIDEETPIGTQNELLSSLFSTTPFEENKPNDKVIYRLPNGKLFEYDPVEENFIQILNDKNFETISESLIGTESITTKEDELIEKIYINNEMSIEEVESTCRNLIMGIFAFGNDLDSQEGHIIEIINYDKILPDYGSGLGIAIVYQHSHQVGIEMAVDEHILFASGFMASDYDFNGWNPDENISEIVLNTYNITKEYFLSQGTEEEEIIAELGMPIDEYIDMQSKELINLISSKPFVKAKDVVIKGKEDEILYPETKASNVKGLDILLEQAANKPNHYVKIDIEGEITFDEEIYNKIKSALKQNKLVLVDWDTEEYDSSIALLGPVLYRGTVYSMSGGAEMLAYDNDVKFVMQFTIKNEIHLYYWDWRTKTVTKEVLSKEIIEVDELPLLEDKPESCYIYSPLGINILNPYAQIRILTLDELPDLSQTFTDNELQDNNIGIGCYTNSILYYFDYISKTWENINTLYGFKGYIDNISEGSFNLDGDDSIDSFYVVKVAKKVKEEYDDNKLYKIKETRCSIVYNYPRLVIEELMYKSMFEIIPCKNLPTIGKPVMNYISIISGEDTPMTVYYEESSKSLKVYVPKIMVDGIGIENEGWFDAFALMSTSEIEIKGIIYNRKELEDKEEGAYLLVETENNIYEIDNVNKIYNRLNGNNSVNIPATLESTILVLDDEQVKKIKYGTNVELNTTMIRPFTLSDSLFEQGRKVFSCSYLDFYNYETLNTTFINVDLILGLASVQFHQTTTPKLTIMRDRLGIGTEPEPGMGISPYSHVPIDQTPTANSINLINSGGVKAYIDSQIGSINTILDEILGEGE